jgi:hypothetical protein
MDDKLGHYPTEYRRAKFYDRLVHTRISLSTSIAGNACAPGVEGQMRGVEASGQQHAG